MLELPNDLLFEIADLLDPQTLCSTCMCCKKSDKLFNTPQYTLRWLHLQTPSYGPIMSTIYEACKYVKYITTPDKNIHSKYFIINMVSCVGYFLSIIIVLQLVQLIF